MASGMQIASTGIEAMTLRLDSIANDIANVNTVGYRPTRYTFRELIDDDGPGGVEAMRAGISSHGGNLTDIGNPISVGLVGPGYVQVQLPEGGTGLTRSGDLRMDGKRQLTLPNGVRLAPPVTIPDGVDLKDVRIASNGKITAAGKELGELKLFEVPAPDQMEGREGGIFVPTRASGAAKQATDTRVEQGVVEASAVDLAEAMVELVEAQRAFEMASKAVHTADNLLELANGIRR
ncbi:MAG: flagellar hook basal-body protein [Gaiellales bacterium]